MDAFFKVKVLFESVTNSKYTDNFLFNYTHLSQSYEEKFEPRYQKNCMSPTDLTTYHLDFDTEICI